MPAVYRVQSVCECQALLEADLDAGFQVLHGSAIQRATAGRAVREPAPANTVGVIGAAPERFDIVWQCPVCGRNTLRSFHVGALSRLPAALADCNTGAADEVAAATPGGAAVAASSPRTLP
jgi:hypothetical protein